MRIAWFSFMTAILTMNFIFGCMLTSKVIGPTPQEKSGMEKTGNLTTPRGPIEFYEYKSTKMSCLILVHLYAIQDSFTQISCSK